MNIKQNKNKMLPGVSPPRLKYWAEAEEVFTKEKYY